MEGRGVREGWLILTTMVAVGRGEVVGKRLSLSLAQNYLLVIEKVCLRYRRYVGLT